MTQAADDGGRSRALSELSKDVNIVGGAERPRFTASLVLTEQRYFKALRSDDPEQRERAFSALRDALDEALRRDNQRLAELAGESRGAGQRDLIAARVRVLSARLDELTGSAPAVVVAGPPRPSRPTRSGGGPAGRPHRRRPPAAPGSAGGGSGHRNDIQGLRAVAVLLVALSHAGVSALKGGFVGVDVFFVLSGFLITGLLVTEAQADGRISLRDFYMRRARRILPAATLTLLVTDIAAHYAVNAVRAKAYLNDSIASAVFGANIHFASIGTDYFAAGQPPSPFQHFWSLAVEEQFYVVWPAVLIVILGLGFRHRHGHRPAPVTERALRRTLITVVVLAAASLAWSVYDTSAHPAAAYFSTPARVWELGIGALLALGAPLLRELPRLGRAALGWVGLILIGVAAATFSAATPFPGYAALLPTVGAAMLIAAGIATRPPSWPAPGRLLALAPLRYIGDRSYAFYLWHWPVLVLVSQNVGHSLSVPDNLLLLCGALALSDLSYRLYERPLRNAAFTRRPQAALLWVASVFAVLVLAATWVATINDHEITAASASQAVAINQLAAAPKVPISASSRASDPGAAGLGGVLPAVAHEVALDDRGRKLPGVVRPTAGQLLGDVPHIPGACTAYPGQTQSSLCHLGTANASHTLILFGDSHAAVWVSDAVAWARRAGWTVVPLIKWACKPPQWVSPTGPKDCRRWFDWAAAVSASIHPSAALVTGYYSWVGADAEQQLGDGLGQAVSTLRRITPHTVLLGDVPQRSVQPVDCLLRPGATATSCSDPLSETEAELTVTVADLAARAHASFVDTTGWFCSSGQCPLVVGSLVTYIDADHVSQTYASALSTVFSSAVSKALGTSG